MGDRTAVDRGRSGGPGERHGDPLVGAHDETAEQHLEGRAVVAVPDQPGAEPVGPSVGGAGATDTDRGQARAAVVLDEDERPGGQHLEGRAHGVPATSTNRTVVPGPRSAGGSRSASQSVACVVPTSCQPPGEGRG